MWRVHSIDRENYSWRLNDIYDVMYAQYSIFCGVRYYVIFFFFMDTSWNLTIIMYLRINAKSFDVYRLVPNNLQVIIYVHYFHA